MNENIGLFHTNSLDLSAVLCALHFTMRAESPITRVISAETGKARDTFWFHHEATSPDFGPLTAAEVYHAWNGSRGESKLLTQSPHAYAVIEYMRAAQINRAEILNAMKRYVAQSALVASQIGGKTFFMPVNASPELEAKMRRMVTENT